MFKSSCTRHGKFKSEANVKQILEQRAYATLKLHSD